MARTDVLRKQKTRWPWVIGVALFLLVLWAISGLLEQDEPEGPEVTVATVADTHPPSAIPAAPYADPPAGTSSGLESLAPLDAEDAGQVVQLEGEVVATGNQGFWIAVGNRVLRVDSERRVRKGATVSLSGTLRPADSEATDEIADAVLSRDADAAEWQVVRELKLVEG